MRGPLEGGPGLYIITTDRQHDTCHAFEERLVTQADQT